MAPTDGPDLQARARQRRRQRRLTALGAILAVYAVGTVVARRLGYELGRNTLVRCRDGHVFSTIWIPGASVKSLRLGWWRYQRCPVGEHWSLVSPVRPADLSDEQRRAAQATRDVRVL